MWGIDPTVSLLSPYREAPSERVNAGCNTWIKDSDALSYFRNTRDIDRAKMDQILGCNAWNIVTSTFCTQGINLRRNLLRF